MSRLEGATIVSSISTHPDDHPLLLQEDDELHLLSRSHAGKDDPTIQQLVGTKNRKKEYIDFIIAKTKD